VPLDYAPAPAVAGLGDTNGTCDGPASLPVAAVSTTTNAFTVADSRDQLLETPTDLPSVKRRTAADEQALEFLRHLGLSEPDLIGEVIEKTLPKYRGQGSQEIGAPDAKRPETASLFARARIENIGGGRELDEIATRPAARNRCGVQLLEYGILKDSKRWVLFC
jgi:hypothetical protein